MKIDAYVQHIPQIEAWLIEHKLDTLVCGLGPTAWLLPWVDQKLLSGIRMWGCHDACRIMPMDDLVIMDNPTMNLNPDSGRYQHTVSARPKRLWLYERNAAHWKGHLAKCLESVTKTVNYSICRPNQVPRDLNKLPFKLVDDPLHTTAVSPTGMTTLAWREGARRIGVIGVEMQKNMHHTHQWWPVVDVFFRKIADQAHELGGCVVNLSPITALKGFASWKPPMCGSAPTNSSTPLEPNPSSNAASSSEPPAQSTSTGCEPATKTGLSPSTEIPKEAGSSVAQ